MPRILGESITGLKACEFSQFTFVITTLMSEAGCATIKSSHEGRFQ